MAKQYSLSRILGFHFLGVQSIYALEYKVFDSIAYGIYDLCRGTSNNRLFKASLSNSPYLLIISQPAKNPISSPICSIPAMRHCQCRYHGRDHHSDHEAYGVSILLCWGFGGLPLKENVMPQVMGVLASHGSFPYDILCRSCCRFSTTGSSLLDLPFHSNRFLCRQSWSPGTPKRRPAAFVRDVKRGLVLSSSIAVLIYFIFFLRLEAMAPYYATVVLLLLAKFRKQTRLNLKSILNLTDGTGKILTELMGIMIGVGMIIGALR